MDFNNAAVAVGIVGSLITIVVFLISTYKDEKDYRATIFFTVLTFLGVFLFYSAAPQNQLDISNINEQFALLRADNDRLVALLLELSGKLPTKEQLDKLALLVTSYRQQIDDLKSQIAGVSDQKATNLRDQLAMFERALQQAEQIRDEYLALHKEQLDLPGLLAGKWLFLTPFIFNKAVLIDGVEFSGNGKMILLERGEPDPQSELTGYSLAAPSTVRLHGTGDHAGDYRYQISGETLTLSSLGASDRYQLIRAGPRTPDRQLTLSTGSITGRWRSTPEDCDSCPGYNRVISLTLNPGQAIFDEYSFDWNQLERDPYDFTSMKANRYESKYDIVDRDLIQFSSFGSDTAQPKWRVRIFSRYLLLESASGSTKHSFMRY